MSETPVIREGTPDDLAQIVPLFIASLDTSVPGVTFSNLPVYAPEVVETRLRPRLFSNRTLKVYVLELPSTGEIVGFASVKPKHAHTVEETVAKILSQGVEGDQDEVDLFFVKRGMGGRGYGGLLLEAFQKDWAGRGGLQLYVFEKNERAIRFYEKMGFRRVPGGEVKTALESEEPLEETVLLMSWRPSS